MTEGIVVIDVGSSKVHGNFIDLKTGDPKQSAAFPYGWLHQDANWSEAEPEEIWKAAESALRTVLGRLGSRDRILGISFSFIGDSLVCTDKKGNALSKLILAFDSRAKKEAKILMTEYGEGLMARVGGVPIRPEWIPVKILWIRENTPETFKRTDYFLNIQQYFNCRLGFGPITDFTLAGRKVMFDIERKEWSHSLCEFIGIDPLQLGGPVLPADFELGEISSFGSVELPYPIPVFLGAHDSDSGMIGLGSTPEDQQILANVTGTFDHLGVVTKQNHGQTPGVMSSYIGPCSDSYILMGASIVGPSMDWFLKLFYPGQTEKILTKIFNQTCFDGKNLALLTAGVETGEGIFHGLSSGVMIPQLFTGLIEGLTFPLRGIAEGIEKSEGHPFEVIRSGGGGAQSDQWLQLKADLLSKPVERVENLEISSLGASLLAACKLNYYRSLTEAVSHLVHVQTRFDPRQDITLNYKHSYQVFVNYQKGDSYGHS